MQKKELEEMRKKMEKKRRKMLRSASLDYDMLIFILMAFVITMCGIAIGLM